MPEPASMGASAPAYALLDRTPMGRHEEGESELWLRRHDEYGIG